MNEQSWVRRRLGWERDLKLMARDRMRKLRQRERMERTDAGYSRSITLPPTTVLQDWFVDEHGCRARRVGCDAT